MGAMIIYSAFCLHIIPAGLLMRPLSFWTKNRKKKPVDKEKHTNSKQDTITYKPTGQRISMAAPNSCTIDSEANGRVDKDHDRLFHRRASEGSNPTSSRILRRSSSAYVSTSSLAIMAHQHDPDLDPEEEEEKAASQTCKQTCDATFCCCCIQAPAQVIPFIEWSLFKNYLFIIYIFGVCLGNTGYLNACLFLPPYANELNVSKSTAALLISSVGVADLFGRIFGGWFADLGLMKRSNLMALSLSITGTTAVVITFFPSFLSLCIVSGVLGLIGGFYISLQAVILVDFLGIEKLSASFGISVMMQGMTNIFVPTGLGLYLSQQFQDSY